MKRAALILAALAAILTAPAVPTRTATENFVTNKIAEAVAAAANAVPGTVSNTVTTAYIESRETDPTVPTWAKSASKPSYIFSEIGRKPTTISGYGITDALPFYEIDDDGIYHTSEFVQFDNDVIIAPGAAVNFPTNYLWLGGIRWQDWEARFTSESDPVWEAEKSGYVQTSRKVNNKALSSDITLSASDVGATTPADVTAAIREQSLGGIWDEELQVWWTPIMRNGSLTYQATTNVNLNAEN